MTSPEHVISAAVGATTVHPSHRAHLRLVDDDAGFATPEETCAAMCADLQAEIKAAKRQQLAHALPILSGELAGREGPYDVYALRVDRRLPPLRAEEPVLLVGRDGAQVPALVIAARQRVLRIAILAARHNALPPGARLVIDNTWLLERLHDRLAQIRTRLAAGKSDPRFNAHMAQLAIGQGMYPDSALEVEPHTCVLANPALAYNESQERALRVAAANPITYVWGPPGTGKTRTVAAIAEEHLRAGRRVIVACPSNAATDVAAEAIAVRLDGDPVFTHGAVLRVGPRPGARLRRAYGPYMVPQDVAARLTEAKYGPRRRTLEEHITRIDAELRSMAADGAQTQCEAATRQRELEGFRTEFRHLREAEEAHRQRCYEQLLDNCRLLVTPIHNVYLSKQVRKPFDVVIIDEASMVTLPQVYLAAGLATGSGHTTRHVVIAGDFRQLPPPVAARDTDQVPWLGTDIFCHVGIPDDIAREDDPPYLVMLDEQHRMAPAIGDFVSTMFYAGRLRTAASTRRSTAPTWALSSGTLLYVDTGSRSPRAVVPLGTSTRENEMHARIVADLVASMTDEADGSHAGQLLLLSPYAGQVDRLHKGILPVVREAGVRDVTVASVHRAQGSEADTVIVTLDDAAGVPVSQFMAARDWAAAGARLLNVAVSRGRCRVVLVLDIEFLKRCGGPMVRAFVHALVEAGTRVDIDEIDGAWEARFGAPLQWYESQNNDRGGAVPRYDRTRTARRIR